METFDASLWRVYDSLIQQFSGITDLANALAALGALLYVSVRVFSAISRGGEIDIFPLLRPFAIGICIILFNPLILTPLNAVTEAVNKGVESVALRNEGEVEQLRQKREVLLDKIHQKNEQETEWYDVGGQIANAFENMGDSLNSAFKDLFQWIIEMLYFACEIVLKTLRIFYLLMLSIIGPLVFGFALFDGISGGIPAWFSRYISISLWSTVIAILKALLNAVHVSLMSQHIADLEAQLAGQVGDGSEFYVVAFYFVGILGFLAVPTVAGWIVEAGGGVGNYGAVVNTAGGRAGGFALGYAKGKAGQAWNVGREYLKKAFK